MLCHLLIGSRGFRGNPTCKITLCASEPQSVLLFCLSMDICKFGARLRASHHVKFFHSVCKKYVLPLPKYIYLDFIMAVAY